MYTLETTRSYTMPTCGTFRAPKPWEAGGMRYGRITSVSVRFRTDRAAIEQCLPQPFRATDDCLISVTLQKCEDVDWLGGRSYNLVGVDAAAIFDGQRDRNVHGSYSIVMWEDMCEPILGGREHSGVPKIFGDIDAIQTAGGAWECKISRFSHQFLAFGATDLKPLDSAACRKMEQDKRDATWMCLKYIPRLENDGADVSYATVYPSSGQCARAWTGQGNIRFSPATFKQVPTQHEVINLLAGLPVREVVSATVAQWQEVRALDRLPRRLV